MAAGASLYPDHVVFLGPGVGIMRDGDDPATASGGAKKLLLAPGEGAAVPADASPSVLAMARALGDVVMRIDPEISVSRLTATDEAALLNWDAEKHRQALEAARSAGP